MTHRQVRQVRRHDAALGTVSTHSDRARTSIPARATRPLRNASTATSRPPSASSGRMAGPTYPSVTSIWPRPSASSQTWWPCTTTLYGTPEDHASCDEAGQLYGGAFCVATHKPGVCAGTKRGSYRPGQPQPQAHQRPSVAVPTAPASKTQQQAMAEQAANAGYQQAYLNAQRLAEQLGGNQGHERVQAAAHDYARAQHQHGRAVARADAARTKAQGKHDTAVARNLAIAKANAAAQAAAVARANAAGPEVRSCTRRLRVGTLAPARSTPPGRTRWRSTRSCHHDPVRSVRPGCNAAHWDVQRCASSAATRCTPVRARAGSTPCTPWPRGRTTPSRRIVWRRLNEPSPSQDRGTEGAGQACTQGPAEGDHLHRAGREPGPARLHPADPAGAPRTWCPTSPAR
jgi:hypothetical protein